MSAMTENPTGVPLLVSTNQNAFDAVCAHLAAMKSQSLKPGGAGCAYRGMNGEKCGIGGILPDGPATDLLDTFSANGVDSHITHSRINPGAVNRDLLGDLQFAHDSVFHWDGRGMNKEGWEYLLRAADRHDLNPAAAERHLS